MEKLAKIQDVEGLEDKEHPLEKNDFKHIRDGQSELEDCSDYLDEIFIRVKQLSGVIAAIGGLGEQERDDEYTNVAWAMSHFTDAIDGLASELWDHLGELGVLQK